VLGAEVDMMTLVGVGTIITGCIFSILSDTSLHHSPALPIAEEVGEEEDDEKHSKAMALMGVGVLRGKGRSVIAA
jgi:hypothetical protein